MKTTPTTLPVTMLMRLRVPFKEAKRTLLDVFERHYVAILLEHHDGNLSAASRASGLSRKHLRALLRRYDLYRPAQNDGVEPPSELAG
jgi:DNA-binding NtrC family response regulator